MHESKFEVLIDSVNKLQGNCFLPRFYMTFQSRCNFWQLGSSSAFTSENFIYLYLSLKLVKWAKTF